jgi:hypothetical protein
VPLTVAPINKHFADIDCAVRVLFLPVAMRPV